MPPTSTSETNNMNDVELGELDETEKSFRYDPTTQAKEPYMDLVDLAKVHALSNIDVDHAEKSRGLSQDEAAKRLEQYGRNSLTPPARVPAWKRLLLQFTNLFLILLNACAVLSVVAYVISHDITNIYLAVILFVVVFLTGFIQFHEEGKAYKIIDSFSKMLASDCIVLREGREQSIATDQLVPGDIVKINNGDKVPADVVLIFCRGLKAECSSLTGESEPVTCTDHVSPETTSYFECKNVAFNSSLCFDGMALGLVFRTGDATAIGAIAKLASDTKMRESTLQIEVKNFVKLVAFIAIFMALISFITSIFITNANTVNKVIKLFINGFLVIIVANVPQGLPATVTSLLAIAARNMAERNVLVKRIDCVETLGSTSIICSDKTGTLTKNEMTVTDVWYDGRKVRRIKRAPESIFGQGPQAIFYRVATVCNKAQPVDEKEQETSKRALLQHQLYSIQRNSGLVWKATATQSVLNFDNSVPSFKGNPSDVALITYSNILCSADELRTAYPIVFEVPFNSTNKWQLVIVKSVSVAINEDEEDEDADVDYEVLMKGAPEVILKKCSTRASTKAPTPNSRFQEVITDEFNQEFNDQYEQFASQGRRVLALCSKVFSVPKNFEFKNEDNVFNFPTNDLNFVGMVAIMDPPRDNVPDAVAKCQNAGVKVFMVTGDHPLTGRSIAEQVGLLHKEKKTIEMLENKTTDHAEWEEAEGAVIHGSRIDALTDEQWSIILSKPGVCFARTTPAHKLEIVRRCQEAGNIVAVTGDGVNDAPALKQADVGVAMGRSGSDVAQDSADILLMDDNFASIVDAIEEGRLIFDNIKKTIAYTMAHIFPEVVSALINLLLGLPAGLTALQVLTIDLGTELGPAISMAYEKAESNIMSRPPRDPLKDRLVSPVLLFYAYVVSGCIISLACIASYWRTYHEKNVHLSDFFHPDLSLDRGAYFSSSSDKSVTIQRTGETFTPAQQQQIFAEGVTAFYITLTVGQFFHIFACKTRISSLFVHGFSNKMTFYGVTIGLCLVIFFCYVPGVQNFVGSYYVAWEPWIWAIVAGAALWIYNEVSKWYFRRAGPQNCLVQWLSW